MRVTVSGTLAKQMGNLTINSDLYMGKLHEAISLVLLRFEISVFEVL